jgi:DNA-binding transcriptional ArsR family regulator
VPAGVQKQLNLNKIIHERARLLILSYLAGSKRESVSFNELKEALEFTAGNLSIHLKSLDEVNYIEIKKIFSNNKPLTSISITQVGIEALNEYLSEMESIIKSLQSSKQED